MTQCVAFVVMTTSRALFCTRGLFGFTCMLMGSLQGEPYTPERRAETTFVSERAAGPAPLDAYLVSCDRGEAMFRKRKWEVFS